MKLVRGQLFRFNVERGHLWFFVTDPQKLPDRAVIANFTTYRTHYGVSPTFDRRDADGLDHDSVVKVDKSRVVLVETILYEVGKQVTLESGNPLSISVLARIVDVFRTSEFCPEDVYDALVSHGLI